MYPGSYLKLRELTVVLHDCKVSLKIGYIQCWAHIGSMPPFQTHPWTTYASSCWWIFNYISIASPFWLLNTPLYLHDIPVFVVLFTESHRQSNSRQVLMLSQSNWKAQGASLAAAMDVWCHRPKELIGHFESKIQWIFVGEILKHTPYTGERNSWSEEHLQESRCSILNFFVSIKSSQKKMTWVCLFAIYVDRKFHALWRRCLHHLSPSVDAELVTGSKL